MSFSRMKSRIEYYGGEKQQDRMILDKKKSMVSSIKYSYQGASFQSYPETDFHFEGLFNPVTNNMDFDTKLLSTIFENNIHVGSIFLWENTSTYWICYNQDLTELAYFRGKCRRCDYKLKWVDGDRQLRETYISVIGPNQPDFRTYMVNGGLSIDAPTANLTVLASNNEQNIKYFNQYQTFVLHGVTYKVHQVDELSMPGVLQLDCQQSYTNQIEDDVENDVKNNWNIQPVVPEYPTSYGIEGPTSIKPLFPHRFEAVVGNGRWYVLEEKAPVKFDSSDLHSNMVVLTWDYPKSGSFTLCYETSNGNVFKKHIVVESLM